LDSKTSELSEPSLSLSLSLPLSLGEEGSNLEVSSSDILFTSLFFFWGRELSISVSIVQGGCSAGSSCIPTLNEFAE
jgi:hypothetical protein